jgi:leucyl aminopeptidase
MLKLKSTKKASDKALIILANSKTSLQKLAGIKSSFLDKKIKSEENGTSFSSMDDQLVFVAFANKKSDSPFQSLQDHRVLGSSITKSVNGEKLKSITLIADASISKEDVMAFIEGLSLENYQYLQFKTDKTKKNTFTTLNVSVDGISQDDLTELENVVEATCFSRDIVNEPVISLNAVELAKRFVQIGKKAGFKTQVLSKKEIEDLKMGGLLGVNLGSIDDPTFTIMTYKPKNAVNKKPLVLVGKGVVYDTGGNNLKPGQYMSDMKSDMGGSAGVAGAIYAIALNKLPVYTIALVPSTDNRIGKNALVADDVITISDGTTVEVKNTDAEGRLILSDALVYAKQYKPMLCIDMATLTGAAHAITGSHGIASVATASEELKNKLKESGERVYERILELPMWSEYEKQLESSIADMSNLGGPVGGVITAGIFLKHFTDYPWIHLDIAGPAFLEKPEPYKAQGGTGTGVRLVYDFAKNMSK